MRIFMLCDSMRIGGAQTHVLTLCEGLTVRGEEVTLVSGGGELAEKLCEIGVGHITLPLGSHSLLDIMKCRRRIRAILRRGEFDIIHSHSRLASALVCGIARRYRIPLVTTVHARFSSTPLRRRLSRWGDLSVAVSQDLKQYLVEVYGVAPENVRVIHNGVDASRFCPRKRSGALTVGFLSRLDGDSSLGAELLCRLAPELCRRTGELRILIGGGGEERERIGRLAAKANALIGRECVVCCGAIGDVHSFLNSCDIFVGVSRAAIEAALCCSAVVLCGNEGFFGTLSPENFSVALKSNFCARGCEMASESELLNSLEALIREGRAELFSRGESLRALSLKSCSAEGMVSATEEVYARALSRYEKGYGSLLLGYYGFGNMGDDILLRASIARARREFSDGVCALTYGGRRDSVRFGVRCIPRASPIAVVSALLGCRRLILGGGTLLQNTTSRRSLVYYASLLIIARRLGKDCLLWGNGIGKIEGSLSSRLLSFALRSCRYVGLRDMRSFALAKHILKGRKAVTVLEGDLAETAEELYSESARAELLIYRSFGDIPPDLVAVVPRAKSGEDELTLLAKAISYERERKSALLFVVMNSKEDERACRELAALFGGKVISGACFGDAVELFKKCRRVYSMRLHGLVAAHIAGVEFFGLGSDDKIRSYCSERGGKYLSFAEEEN